MYRMLPELRTPKILHVLVDLLVRIPDKDQRRYNSDYASGHYACGRPGGAFAGVHVARGTYLQSRWCSVHKGTPVL